ncbi:MAG TPA: hypothetical protein VMT77_03905, partial [Gemmatimonadales bacterium]|nr:hypothetical protein [Gemmatimonadales bacterium]
AVVLLLFPIGTALLFPAVTALVSHESDPKELGQTMGVQQAYGGVARVVGPMWSTPVFQLLGPSVPFYFIAGIVGVAGALAFQVPIAVRVRPPVPAD